MISTRFESIFLHAPKTAGTSIGLALNKDIPQTGESLGKLLRSQNPGLPHHASLREVRQYMEEGGKLDLFNSFFKFTFVRNPFSQLYSFFNFHAKWMPSQGLSSVFIFEGGFEDFLCNLDGCKLSLGQIRNKSEKGIMNAQGVFGEIFQKQYAYIDGNLGVDFIGRFESLQADFNIIAKILNISNSLPRAYCPDGKRPPYWQHYSTKSREIAENLLKEDLEIFSYCF